MHSDSVKTKDPVTLEEIQDQVGPVFAHARIEYETGIVLVKRRHPVFEDKPFVTWELTHYGLWGGHYDLDEKTGWQDFIHRVASHTQNWEILKPEWQ